MRWFFTTNQLIRLLKRGSDSISRTPRATKESTGAYYAWIDIPLDDLTLRVGFHGTRGLLILTRSGESWHQEYPAT